MNRFRTKKRTKDEVSAPRPSIDSESSGPFKMFGKNKKAADNDSKRAVDLDAALPATDDFRTSLLMTGLSARFSMLREQDDPFSKLGKASDDSVLQPKRQSRLMDYGFTSGLQDIAEIESIKAANLQRVDSSQTSDTNSINGRGIMDRSRPNEGNNLFGGRQKIYRVPAASRGGGMGGRALYDDDVAKSAFQKWKQNERERLSMDDDLPDPDSPLFDYNRRRETNSTTSSGLSAGRNSTAATSVASQFASTKDAPAGIPASASNAPGIDRGFTRTRRLYEQGLTQDLQDHQTSALSRMDTLSKSRRAARTPEVPSPTSATFGERAMDKKTVLAKGSAPNLRSFTPPTSGSFPAKDGDATAKFSAPEPKPSSYGVSPPLSPPISEADEHPTLPIQPNDRGKATAMGVFNRPSHQYDDSQYTQRQRQMQHDRDGPLARSPSHSRSSANASRSRSSSMHRRNRHASDNLSTRADAKKDYQASSFFDDSDEPSTPNNAASPPNLAPQLSVERPSDNDHPAFRKSALPTPLSLSSRASDDETCPSDKPESGPSRPKDEPPEDSPTLPPGAGLSGMVRQHLRSQSTASSIYDNPQAPNGEAHEADSPEPGRLAGRVDTNANSWGLNDDEFTDSGSGTPTTRPARADSETRREQDDFARHLADGARRVREKLTSYAEPDSEQTAPPLPPSESTKDLAAARSNALGILRTKSSRTSLFDRKGDREQGELKPSKSGKLVKPSPSAQSVRKASDNASQDRGSAGSSHGGKEEGNHAGLKAFRQARRELQKMKELEVQQRHTSPQKGGSPPERPGAQRAFSDDPGMSPPMPNRTGYSSRQVPPPERDRSGSDTSNELRESRRPEVSRGHPGYGGHLNSSPKGKRRDVSEPAYRHSDGLDGRQHSAHLLGATASTPNLHAPSSAPPLPPINPRRKSPYGGIGRRSEDARAPHTSHGAVNGDGLQGLDGLDGGDASEQQRQRLRRVASDHNGDRIRQHPPAPTHRPPIPHANVSGGSMPGGMI